MSQRDSLDAVRLDKWLWAARFFKTRSLAAAAVDGGKVHLNGTRAKRGKTLRVGDGVRLRKGPFEFVVTVRRLSERRGSATEAQTLYEESPSSRHAREVLAEQHRLAADGHSPPKGRPTKRDRRKISRIRGRDA